LNWVLAMPDDEVNDCLRSINGSLSKSQREHLVETNKLAAWVDDNLVLKEGHVLYIGASTSALKDQCAIDRECDTKLYPNYLRWCAENGVQAIAVQRFSNNLLDIAEHCKLPINSVNRDSNGRKIAGFKIRTLSDSVNATPITQTLLNADECRSHVDTDTPQTRENADSVEDAALSLSDDTEVF
jgi:putative DNA primase/helicase